GGVSLSATRALAFGMDCEGPARGPHDEIAPAAGTPHRDLAGKHVEWDDLPALQVGQASVVRKCESSADLRPHVLFGGRLLASAAAHEARNEHRQRAGDA